MRKLLIFFLFYQPFMAVAQTKIGIRGGMNWSTLIYRPQYSGGGKGSEPFLPRLNAGLLIEIPLNDDNDWFIHAGPYYSGKGSGSGLKLFSTKNDTVRTYLNYIELPVSVQYKFSEGSKNRVGVSGGLYISYGFNGERLWKGGIPPAEKHLHRKEENRYKRLDAGLNASFMYELKGKYGIKFDYSGSVFNISRQNYNSKVRNNVFGFSFFWYLKNKKSETD